MPRFLGALNNIIGAIHPAEAQVCANWVLLRRETRLANIIYFKIIVIDAREERSDETLPRE